MKDKLRGLFGDTAIYGLSSISTKLISIFLIPLYTKVLEPADYGVLNLVTAVFSLALVLSVFALDNSAARWYYESEDVHDKKSTICSWFYFQLSLTLFIGGAILIFSNFISEHILNIDSTKILWVAGLSFMTGTLPSITPNWFRMQRKPKPTVAYTITFSLITISLTIYFVLIRKEGVIGIFMASLIANICMSVVSFILLRGWLNIKYFNKERLLEMLKFAAPLTPTIFAFWVLNSSASFFLERFQDKTELGLFQIAVSISSGITLLITAFRLAFPPFAYSIYKDPAAKQIFANVLTLYSIIMISTALLFALFSEELLQLFTEPAYHSAALTASILFFNNIIYGYSNIVGLGNGIMKDNRPLAISVFIGSIITAVLFFVLVPSFGKEGAALSMAAGYLVIPIYVFISSQKKWYIPFKPLITLVLFLTAAGLLVTVYLTKSYFHNFYLIYRFGIWGLFLFFTLLVIYFYDKQNFLNGIRIIRLRWSRLF